MKKILLSGSLLVFLVAGTSAQHQSIGGYNVYYGDLHNHSSVSDGTGTPSTAYNYAKNVAHLDFFALTDHSGSISSAEWTDIQTQANAYNQDGVFTAFYGFEWTSGGNYGHIGILNTGDYCTTNSPTSTFEGLVSWLASRPEGFAFFCHPGRENGNGLEFNHFATTPSEGFVGMELWNNDDAYTDYYYNDGYYTNDNNIVVKLKDNKTYMSWDQIAEAEFNGIPPMTDVNYKEANFERLMTFTILKLTQESGQNFGINIEDWDI